MKLKYKIELGIVILFVILPLAYLIYDRSLIPPITEYQSPSYVPNEPWEQYATRFLESSKQPNALEHYLKAFSLYSTETNVINKELFDMQTVIKFGWTKPYPVVEQMLQHNQAAMQEIILGARMKRCLLPPVPFGENTPRPMNYLKNQHLAKLIAITGKKEESKLHYHQAMQDYLDGIQFGSDMSQKDQSQIAVLIGINLMRINTRPLIDLILENKLTESDYQYLISELNRLDQNVPDMREVARLQYHQYSPKHYRQELDHPLKYAQTLNRIYLMNQNLKRPGLGNWPSNQEYKKTINSSRYQFRTLYFAGYIFFNKGRILRNESEYSAASDKEFTTKNYRELTNVNWENIMPKDKVNRLIIDFAKDLNLQIYRAPLIGQTELRLGQIQSAIQLYQLEKKQWPKKIEELNTYLSSIPIDPFSEKPFLWAMDAAGKPTAYSVGPDFKDDAAKITYDPTNGMVSVGDIIP